MLKYLKLFDTHDEYVAFTQTEDFLLPNVSYCENITDEVHYNPIVPPNPNKFITYMANAKLIERQTTNYSENGLHVNCFNASVVSHTFENGVGTIEFDEEVTSINSNAFRGCTGMTFINIPNSVTNIGENGFYNCSSLANIDIPDTILYIGGGAFQNCSSLPSENNIRYADDKVVVEVIDKTQSTYLIKDGIITITNQAFKDSRVVTINLPQSLKVIGNYAFQNCTALRNIVIPENVTNINSNAFVASSLVTLTCLPIVPPVLGAGAMFDIYNPPQIYVPSESVEAYKTAENWSSYSAYIGPIS